MRSPPFTHSITKNNLERERERERERREHHQLKKLPGHNIKQQFLVANNLSSLIDTKCKRRYNIEREMEVTCFLSGSWSEGPPEMDGWKLVQTHVSQSAPSLYPVTRRGGVGNFHS